MTISTCLDTKLELDRPESSARIISFYEYQVEPQRVRKEGVSSVNELVSQFEKKYADGKEMLSAATKEIANHVYTDNDTLPALRSRAGLSQRDLAKKIKSTQSYIGRIETGKADPGRKIMRSLCVALNVDMNELDKALS